MFNDIFNELTSNEEIELIYSNKKEEDNVTAISYDIIVTKDNVLENIDLCKKIIALMEVIKELFTKMNINITYNIKSSSVLENEIIGKKKSIINKLQTADIIYSKDEYFLRLIESVNGKKHGRA